MKGREDNVGVVHWWDLVNKVMNSFVKARISLLAQRLLACGY